MRTRDRKKAAFWRRMVAGQEASGESVRGFCRRHRLSEKSFYRWRRELRRREMTLPGGTCEPSADTEAASADEAAALWPAFVPVRLREEPSGPGRREARGSREAGRRQESPKVRGPDAPADVGGRMEVVWPDGLTIRLFGAVDRRALSAVLAALQGDSASAGGLPSPRRDQEDPLAGEAERC